jgi:uncharacterized protein
MSRVSRYPLWELPTGIRLHRAHTWRARLLGLALINDLRPDEALLIPRCMSVHTFGMRFALDVVFVDDDWSPVDIEHGVPPRRLLHCRQASAVIEVRAGEGSRLLDGLRLLRAHADES